ncbi:hypothetical protein OG809_30595 [Kribbella soli]
MSASEVVRLICEVVREHLAVSVLIGLLRVLLQRHRRHGLLGANVPASRAAFVRDRGRISGETVPV